MFATLWRQSSCKGWASSFWNEKWQVLMAIVLTLARTWDIQYLTRLRCRRLHTWSWVCLLSVCLTKGSVLIFAIFFFSNTVFSCHCLVVKPLVGTFRSCTEAPKFKFQLFCPNLSANAHLWGERLCSSRSWFPPTYVRNLDWVPGSWILASNPCWH